jgi:hypothetical protein
MGRREWGNDIVPDYILQQQQKRIAAEAKVRAYEVQRDNAAAYFRFLNDHGGKVSVEVAGVTFEAAGRDILSMMEQVFSHVGAIKRADDAERQQFTSLSKGT